MDAVYAVMAARVAEEEQTQRTMIALNEMKPNYPGKGAEEVKTVLDEVWTRLLLCKSLYSYNILLLPFPHRSIVT